MDEVEVSHACIDQSFKWRQANALNSAPPHAELTMINTVPSRYRCLFPHILAEATNISPATPTPHKWYPVNNAICVKSLPK
ncbi:MAG: hypothetical protein L6R37_000076 [Teloschistes peruensis]|nr:MAG: hypothetical protein L6R37_000076 [Teloschistes peruensis]